MSTKALSTERITPDSEVSDREHLNGQSNGDGEGDSLEAHNNRVIRRMLGPRVPREVSDALWERSEQARSNLRKG